jgi:quaternary ammonium compound-resistance protein SugE
VAWLFLLAAGLSEIVFAASLERSHGLTRPWLSVAVVVAGGLSLYLLSAALL